MSDFDVQAEMLARAVLDKRRHSSGIGAEVASGDISVDITLKGMVHAIRERVWMNQATIAAMVTARIEQAASEVNIAKLVADAVDAELSVMRSDVYRAIRARLQELVDKEIRSELDRSKIHMLIQGALGDIVGEAMRKRREEIDG